MIPKAGITKADGNTGVVRDAPDGVLAIIAPSQQGTVNQPAGHTSDRRALAQFGHGKLVEFAAIVMSISKKPVVLIRGQASTAAAFGTVTHTGAGTSVVTASGTPLDDYPVVVKFLTGGTIGVAGITYQESLDGGTTFSGTKALGAANSLTIPDSGVTLNLAAGTILANQTEAVQASAAKMTNADILLALEALRVSQYSYEAVLLAADAADATNFASLATWLSARNAEGKFKHGYMNTRFMTSGEAESAFKTAMDTAFGASSSIDIGLGADGGYIPSPIRSLVLKRPTALFAAARAMAIAISVEPAYVALGPIANLAITDAQGNPRDHNEEANPGLDDSRFITLRTIAGETGTFINRTRLFSPNGSDYQLLPHARVMNAACETAQQLLQKRLNIGVQKNAKARIEEGDASLIESAVDDAIEARIMRDRHASGVGFLLSRDDDLSSNAGAAVSGEVELAPLVYINEFKTVAKFVRKISAKPE